MKNVSVKQEWVNSSTRIIWLEEEILGIKEMEEAIREKSLVLTALKVKISSFIIPHSM